MNKKILRNAIIAVLSISVLVVIYILISKWNPDENKNTIVLEQDKEIVLIDIDTESINQIQVKNASGSYVIKNEKDYYSVPEYPNARFLQTRLSTPFNIISKLTADRIISKTNDNMDFGLQNPNVTVTISLNDENIVNMFIGNPDPTNNGFYVMTQSNENVYLVSKGKIDVFFEDVDYFRNLTISAFDSSEITGLELYKGGEKVTSIRLKNDSDTLQELVVGDLVMTYPYYQYVMADKLTEYFKDINKIECISVISDTASDLLKYSIGAYTLKIQCNETTHTLKLGKKDGNGNVFAAYDGYDAIFLIDDIWLEKAENLRPIDYMFKLVHIYNLDDVSEVELISPSGSITLENGAELTINGQKTDEIMFKKAYLQVIELSATSYPDNKEHGIEVGSVTFKLNSGKVDCTRYYDYDERNYLIITSDGTEYLTLKKNFDSLFGNIAAALN